MDRMENRQTFARAIFVLWSGIVLVCLLRQDWLVATFKLPARATLLVTLGLVLAQLFLPFAQGILQGRQQFSWLGASIMMNGVGRFIAIYFLMEAATRAGSLVRPNSTTALAGALAGLGRAAVVVLAE